MAISKDADDPIDPHEYVAKTECVGSDGLPCSAAEQKDGKWRTVVDRLFQGTCDESRLIFDGMTRGESELVHILVNNNPEVAFRNGKPME